MKQRSLRPLTKGGLKARGEELQEVRRSPRAVRRWEADRRGQEERRSQWEEAARKKLLQEELHLLLLRWRRPSWKRDLCVVGRRPESAQCCCIAVV